MALKSDGSILAWGDNSRGQCDLPADLGPIAAIAAGAGHTVVLKADGTVRGWGANWNGQCGPPAGVSNVLGIAAGNSHTVFLVGSAAADPELELPGWQSGAFSVLLQTYPGRNYGLDYKNSLGASTWTSLPGIAGNGSKQFLVDRNASGPTRCYRVRQW